MERVAKGFQEVRVPTEDWGRHRPQIWGNDAFDPLAFSVDALAFPELPLREP